MSMAAARRRGQEAESQQIKRREERRRRPSHVCLCGVGWSGGEPFRWLAAPARGGRRSPMAAAPQGEGENEERAPRPWLPARGGVGKSQKKKLP